MKNKITTSNTEVPKPKHDCHDYICHGMYRRDNGSLQDYYYCGECDEVLDALYCGECHEVLDAYYSQNDKALAEYVQEAERKGMTKSLDVGEYGIARNGLIIVRYENGDGWGLGGGIHDGTRHYEVFPPIGYCWEQCSKDGVHGLNEGTLAMARRYDIADAEPCDGDGDCFWGDWIYEPEKHHPIELMENPYNTLGEFNPFFS